MPNELILQWVVACVSRAASRIGMEVLELDGYLQGYVEEGIMYRSIESGVYKATQYAFCCISVLLESLVR